MNRLMPLLVAGLSVAGGLLAVVPAQADSGWIAVAKSPLRESLDWAGGSGRDRYDAEAEALGNCAVLQNASDCIILGSGPGCVAVAWDASEPLNVAYAAEGVTPATAITAAVGLAGPFANDPSVRCSYFDSAANDFSSSPAIARYASHIRFASSR